jgi:tRNA threonylcarbamoyl adenosine modification protein YeaZ
MNWLIIETSSNASCLVLASQDRIIAHKALIGGEHLSRTLAREVEQLLTQHPLALDAIAVGTGPGSYTGIRVGAALAQSLAFGWNIPVSGFCSLAGYATDLPVAVDARGGGIYLLDRGQLSKIPIAELTVNELVSPDAAILQQRLPEKRWIQAAPDPVALLAAEKSPLQFRYL